MGSSVFISYCHEQAEWVRRRLVSVLRASGLEILIDHEQFVPGRALPTQIYSSQKLADHQLLIFSPGYMQSKYCMVEMERAVEMDPDFKKGKVIPIKRVAVELPEVFHSSDPLYIDFNDDSLLEPWDLLLSSCGSQMAAVATSWLVARDEVERLLQRGESVNFVVDGSVEWRELISDLQKGELDDLKVVDLERPVTVSRRGLIGEILRVLGSTTPVPDEPYDLEELERFITLGSRRRLALVHFDMAAYRDTYGVDFFAALRYLVTETSNLVLLIQSRRSFESLLPRDHPLSNLPLLQVRLGAR